MKYILIGGNIRSKNDEQEHFVPAVRLMKLYGLEKDECLLIDNEQDKQEKLRGRGLENCIVLYPRYDGDYKEHLKVYLTGGIKKN